MMLSLHMVSVLFIIIKHNWMCAVDWLFQFSVHSNNAKWLDEIAVERVVSRFHRHVDHQQFSSTLTVRLIWVMVDYLMPFRVHSCTFAEWRIYLVENTENYLVSASVSAHRGLKSRNTSEVRTEGEEGCTNCPPQCRVRQAILWKL